MLNFDWSYLPDNVQWLTLDEDGLWSHVVKPELRNDRWLANATSDCIYDVITGVEGVHAEKLIWERPKSHIKHETWTLSDFMDNCGKFFKDDYGVYMLVYCGNSVYRLIDKQGVPEYNTFCFGNRHRYYETTREEWLAQ